MWFRDQHLFGSACRAFAIAKSMVALPVASSSAQCIAYSVYPLRHLTSDGRLYSADASIATVAFAGFGNEGEPRRGRALLTSMPHELSSPRLNSSARLTVDTAWHTSCTAYVPVPWFTYSVRSACMSCEQHNIVEQCTHVL